ncbi:hypothetical protein COEREDRAFT_81394 [Coemansia reversa NRRL 1564]|uniref:Uncharacterized protein n=1 Tax=Coemansia reversa (strain ATCC 12441 / NRRL 1564) TaxID=763665 RepID=A0A2G5BB03_COERN|nr:hypothetical protein COEREDRAFT_81394 [Coemansia reversa NRRL 1564]|eukprot:PIA16172.1 hypothetical protein COEREDRAFT_81394 [Coemansia reversa NRRL 1564]
MHPDLRNSHIQVHHQLVYQLEYQVLSPDMISVVQQKEPRVRAAAHILGSLGRANIVRREELNTSGLATMPAGQTHLVRGTLPVALVPAKIASLWAIRGLEHDPLEEPSAVVAAISNYADELVANSTDTELQNTITTQGASSSGYLTGIHRSSLVSEEIAGAVLETGHNQSTDGNSCGSSLAAPEPAIQSSESSGCRSSGTGMQDNREHRTEENQTESVSVISTPALAQPPQSIGISGTNTSYNPLMFQQQIEQFQAQQRQQQHQFFSQLAEQYASLVADGHTLLTSSLPRELEEHLSATISLSNTAAGHAPVSEPESLHTSIASDSSTNTSAHSSQGVAGALPLLSPADAVDNHSNSVSSNIVTLPQANIRHSPPPSYDDLLPPAYDVDSRHPPPYRSVRRR